MTTATVLKAGEAIYGGYVLAREEGVVFIKGAIPGEVVEVVIEERKRDYSIASVTSIIEPSEFRISPPCPYFGECGGCQLQFIQYEKQVSMKNEILVDCLSRIGGLDVEPLEPLFGVDFRYRHRGQFKVSKEGKIGFYREGTREVVRISECPLMKDEINQSLRTLTPSEVEGLKEVHITSGDCLTALVKGRGFSEELAERLVTLGFAGVAFEDMSYRGAGFVTLDLCSMSYTVSPWSFLQSNWELNNRTVQLLKEELGSVEGMRVLDLYAGGGNFSLPLAERAAGVVAIEENPHCIKDGERNLSLNGIENYSFLASNAETAKLRGTFDIIVLDPPRPGLTKAAIRRVKELRPQKMAYVSCNPSTLARDIKRLGEFYELDSVRMLDYFPNAYHVEALAILSLQGR